MMPRLLNIIFLCPLLFNQNVDARNLCLELFTPTSTKQTGYSNELQADVFTTGRGLGEVSGQIQFFKDGHRYSFLDEVRALKAGEHFIDSGTGKGYVIADVFQGSHRGYLKAFGSLYPFNPGKIKVTGIGFVQPKEWAETIVPELNTYTINPADYRYLKQRYVEDIPTAELTKFGKAALILDSVGPVAYSDRVDLVLQKYFDVLKTSGVVVIYLGKMSGDRLTDARFHPTGDNYITEITLPNGKRINFLDWVESIPGLKIHRDKLFEHSKPGLNSVRIEKVAEEILVPRLEIVEYRQGRPPFRIFRVLE